MVSLSNGSLSTEVSNKRPLENGCMPKFKPRKVSAVRDFPPGCGTNAVPMNLRSEEKCGSEAAGTTEAINVASLELTNTVVECQPREEGSSSTSLSFQHWITGSTNVSVTEAASESLMEKAMENATISKKLAPEVGSVETKGEAESHRQEAVNNPVELERDEQLGSYVGNVETTVINGLPNEVQEVMLESDLVGVDIVSDMKILDHPSSRNTGVEVAKSPMNSDDLIGKDLLPGNSLVFSVTCGIIQPGTSIRPRDKYRPRRVSAVREFPPNCGPNLSLSIEEEKVTATPVKVSLSKNEEVELTPKPTMSTVPGREIPHGDSSFRRELVHGLMAAPYCPWRQKVPLQQKPRTDASNSNPEPDSSGYPSLKNAGPDSHDEDKIPGEPTFIDEEDHGATNECMHEATPISTFKAEAAISDDDHVGPIRKNISPGDSDEGRNSRSAFGLKDDEDSVVAAPHCPRRKDKPISNSDVGSRGGRKRKQNLSWGQKSKAVARRSKPEPQSSGSSLKKKNKVHMSDDGDDKDLATNSQTGLKRKEYEVNLFPQFGPKCSDHGDARYRVRQSLRCFNAICRKLLQQEEAEPEGEEGKSRQSGKKVKRIDLLTVEHVKKSNLLLNQTKMIGAVPGVEVGDEFQYRVELKVVGIHFPYQSGIDYMKVNDVLLATSIVASGAYSDDVENADVLRYSGQGGNIVGKCKKPEDQKMERGNLALKNCIAAKTPVRVVRGWKEMKYVDPLDSRPKLITTYVYDGLYTVTDYCTEKGPDGQKVFMFELKRNPGQPELAWKELKKASKPKMRPGLCVSDISEGKERIPIWAVNTINDEKPPPFKYISKMMYPDWYSPKPPKGCRCTGKCSTRKKCECALRNGGDIPYNHNGALVETKTLVYECGPHCTCPPSCYNRSTQRGIKFQLEIFKTESRGWGVRALTSITSGSFICEYTGELLEDKEAEERIGNDEYLFDIGQSWINSPTNSEDEEAAAELKGGGFTIDALTYGGVGRFINHSCSPNLWAQNVIYDNDDKRIPHVMLFAMENIPPLTELTYSYNYSLGQIRDSEGNIKIKKCYCGADGCSGRLY